MKNIGYFRIVSVFLLAAYLLAACGGTLPQNATSRQGPKVEANIVAFSGVVEAINGNEWTVNGQKITLDPQTSLDPNVRVGDEVKVEASVAADGTVVVLKIESSVGDDVVSSSTEDASSTLDPISTPSPDETPDVSGSPDAPQAASANENEVFGTVEAITADSVTVNGVTYSLANFTEIKDVLTAGDQVKLHVILNADGTFTVREIEKSVASFDNGSGSSGSHDGPSHDANDDHSKGNGADDGPSHDSNDDHGGNSGSGGSDD